MTIYDASRPAALPSPTYPWPEEEMIARYGLRYLTAEEQAIFPGLSLALAVFKARLIKPPAAAPGARVGWIVWIAETYPGAYLVRLPGGASLLAPHHDITWERISDETLATTLIDVRVEEKRRLVEAQKWQPGQVITTPHTRLAWSDLAGWLYAWGQLQRRPHSSDRYRKEDEHIRALPVEMIASETEEGALYDFLAVMDSGSARRPKGMRAKDPTTPLVVAANNRLTQLGAIPYRQYRQQQSLRSVLKTEVSNAVPQPAPATPPHLFLF